MHVCTDTCFKVRLSEAEGRVAAVAVAAEEVREALALRSREPQVVEAPTRASTAARVAEAHAHERASAAEARAALAERMLAAAEAKAEAAEARAVEAQRFIDSFINS